MTLPSAAASSAAYHHEDTIRLVSNIFISFIGAGVLGLPYAFKEAGLLEGALVMSLVCYLSVKAMLLLIDCKYHVLSRAQAGGHGHGGKMAQRVVSNGKEYVEIHHLDEDADADADADTGEDGSELGFAGGGGGGGKAITYSDVAFAAFGPPGRLVIDSALLVSQIGFCCAYLIFITENLSTFVNGLTQYQWLIVILPPLFFLTLIPDLRNLAIFSLFAQISNLFAFAVVFWFDFEHLHLASPEHRREFSIRGFPFFFSVAIYCFEGAGMILSLEHSVTDALRPKFKKYFVSTIVAVTVLYITFGVSGYLSYGVETLDIITLNLPSDSGLDFAVVVKACLSFSLFFTYPIMLFPVTSLLEERLRITSSSSFYPNVVRMCLVTTTGVVIVLVPRFADLMALVGATCCTLLAFVMPGLCHFVLFKHTLQKAELTLDYVLVGTGISGAILGTIDALKKIATS